MSLRIRAICGMLEDNIILADIGTDHALLPILAVESGKAIRAYACDVAAGPLLQAEANIREKGLTDQIKAIRSDGFDYVPQDADTAVLAGMGYHTALTILDRAMERIPSMKELIIQVNKDVPMVRRWISEHHFTITKECTVFDRGKYYTAVAFSPAAHEVYSEEELLGGVLEKELNSDVLADYLENRINKLRFISEKQNHPDALENEINLLESVRQKLTQRNELSLKTS